MMKFGPDCHKKNMFWTATKILNSCTEELREKIEEIVQGYPVKHRTGTRKLEDLKLGLFEGENVQSATSLIKEAVGLLSYNGATPTDIMDIAFNIMKTSSTMEILHPYHYDENNV